MQMKMFFCELCAIENNDNDLPGNAFAKQYEVLNKLWIGKSLIVSLSTLEMFANKTSKRLLTLLDIILTENHIVLWMHSNALGTV